MTATEGNEVDVLVMQLSFPTPADRLNMNGRVHWHVRARLTKLWRAAAWAAALKHLGEGPAARQRPPCMVRVSFPTSRPNQRRDPHNWAPTVKAIVDGLVDARVWPDDNDQWVTILDSRFHPFTPTTSAPHGLVVVDLLPRAGAIPA